MPLEPITRFTSRTAVLDVPNVDTDQIIPARFLTTTSRDGLGAHAFQDWRYDASGAPKPDFVLNRPEAQGAQILVAGHNFGCGSSREHAPWALLDAGIRAVISTEIADIFRGNALKNGLIPVVLPADPHRWLIAHPGADLTIDVAAATVTLPDGSHHAFDIDGFARHCLVNGIDELGFLLSQEAAIAAYETRTEAR